MSRRPLVLVIGLTVGDYLLWNWSLSGNHDVIALVSGLTLPPLVLASLWLLALGGRAAIARSRRAQMPRGRARRASDREARCSGERRTQLRTGGAALGQLRAERAAEPSRKIAA